MWKNTVEPDRPHMTTWRLRIACWVPKGTNTRSVYVIRIAFPQQKQLHVHASMLCTLPVLFSFVQTHTTNVTIVSHTSDSWPVMCGDRCWKRADFAEVNCVCVAEYQHRGHTNIFFSFWVDESH
jgi:hypothetical protein